MTDKTAPARQARLKARNADRGLVKVSVWVPEHKRSKVLRMAQEARQKHFNDYIEATSSLPPWDGETPDDWSPLD